MWSLRSVFIMLVSYLFIFLLYCFFSFFFVQRRWNFIFLFVAFLLKELGDSSAKILEIFSQICLLGVFWPWSKSGSTNGHFNPVTIWFWNKSLRCKKWMKSRCVTAGLKNCFNLLIWVKKECILVSPSSATHDFWSISAPNFRKSGENVLTLILSIDYTL